MTHSLTHSHSHSLTHSILRILPTSSFAFVLRPSPFALPSSVVGRRSSVSQSVVEPRIGRTLGDRRKLTHSLLTRSLAHLCTYSLTFALTHTHARTLSDGRTDGRTDGLPYLQCTYLLTMLACFASSSASSSACVVGDGMTADGRTDGRTLRVLSVSGGLSLVLVSVVVVVVVVMLSSPPSLPSLSASSLLVGRYCCCCGGGGGHSISLTHTLTRCCCRFRLVAGGRCWHRVGDRCRRGGSLVVVAVIVAVV